MANKITATITFHFKGTQFSPNAELDLDTLMQQHGSLPQLHQMLAQRNDIDLYSYEYEMMLTEDVQFSDASDLAKEFLIDGHFDQSRFEQQWHENYVLTKLAPIVKQHLDIDDIEQHQELKTVLLAACKLAKSG